MADLVPPVLGPSVIRAQGTGTALHAESKLNEKVHIGHQAGTSPVVLVLRQLCCLNVAKGISSI